MESSFESSQDKKAVSKNIREYSNSKFTGIFYKTVLEVFDSLESNKRSKTLDKISFIVIYLILYFQFTSLLWKPGMKYYGWKDYDEYWKILGYMRIDIIFYQIDIQDKIYYVLSALVYTVFGTFSLILLLSLKKIKTPKFTKWIVGKLMQLENTILFIPILTFFSILVSDYFTPSEVYYTSNSVSLSQLGVINCVFCIAIHLFTTFLSEYMSFDVVHASAKNNFQAKATCSTDIKRILSRVIIVELYCFFSVDLIEVLHILCGLVCVWLGSMYLVYLPYYNKAANTIAITKIGCELFTVICFSLNYIINSSGFLFLSNLFVIPLMLIMLPELVDYRYSFIKNNKLENLKNSFLFEIYMRDKLCDFENPDISVINDFTKYKSLFRMEADLIAIWECNYCIYTLKDYRLAYIKLSRTHLASFSLETVFQEYKCRRVLKSSKLDKLEDLSFLNYLNKLEKAKKADKIICQIYFEFASEIVSKEPSVMKLENFVTILHKKLGLVKRGYENLKRKYPKAKECLNLLLSFNSDICMKSESSFIERLKFRTNERTLAQAINYYEENNGILLISAEKSNIGMILYANDQFAAIVGGSTSTIIGSNLNTLIPSPYNINHNRIIQKYASECTTSSVKFPGSLFIQTERGYLVECYMKITCASLYDNIFYLVVVQKIKNKREAALISESGLIYCHTESLKYYLSSDFSNYRNLYLYQLIPDLNISLLEVNNPVEVYLNSQKFYVIKISRVIVTSEITVLLFINGDEALEQILKEEFEGKDIWNITNLIEKSHENRIGGKDIQPKVKFGLAIDDEIFNAGHTTLYEDKTIENSKVEEEKKNSPILEQGSKSFMYDFKYQKMIKGLVGSKSKIKLMKWLLLAIVRSI